MAVKTRRMQSPRNGSVPNPDPTERTVEQFLREVATSREIVEAKADGNREVFETRLGGMDLAIELLQKASDKIPQFIKDQVKQLQELHDEKFNSISTQIDIQFNGIGGQFTQLQKQTELLSLADKTAIAAALQAQKEAAGATTEMVIAAITKMDANFTKLIEQTQNLLTTNTRNTDEKINDLKGRFDRGEGRPNETDPQLAETMRMLRDDVRSLSSSRDVGAGRASSHEPANAELMQTLIAKVERLDERSGESRGRAAAVTEVHKESGDNASRMIAAGAVLLSLIFGTVGVISMVMSRSQTPQVVYVPSNPAVTQPR